MFVWGQSNHPCNYSDEETDGSLFIFAKPFLTVSSQRWSITSETSRSPEQIISSLFSVFYAPESNFLFCCKWHSETYTQKSLIKVLSHWCFSFGCFDKWPLQLETFNLLNTFHFTLQVFDKPLMQWQREHWTYLEAEVNWVKLMAYDLYTLYP